MTDSLAHTLGEAWAEPNRCPNGHERAVRVQAFQRDKDMSSTPPSRPGKDSFLFFIIVWLFVSTIYSSSIWVVIGETNSICFKYETVVTTKQPSLFWDFPGKWRGRTLRRGYIISSLPGKCSPWSEDTLQFIIVALLFSPSYIVVTHNSEYNLYSLKSTGDTLSYELRLYRRERT